MLYVAWLRRVAILLCLFIFFLLQSCGTTQNQTIQNSSEDLRANINWSYAPQAIMFEAQTSPRLNHYADQAHSIALVIIQVADANIFYRLLGDPERLANTVQFGSYAEGFLQISRFVLEPDSHVSFSFDRMKNTQYIGVIAAYYGVPIANMASLLALPVKITENGFWRKQYQAQPTRAKVYLQLGGNVIENAEIMPMPSDAPFPATREKKFNELIELDNVDTSLQKLK